MQLVSWPATSSTSQAGGWVRSSQAGGLAGGHEISWHASDRGGGGAAGQLASQSM